VPCFSTRVGNRIALVAFHHLELYLKLAASLDSFYALIVSQSLRNLRAAEKAFFAHLNLLPQLSTTEPGDLTSARGDKITRWRAKVLADRLSHRTSLHKPLRGLSAFDHADIGFPVSLRMKFRQQLLTVLPQALDL